MIVRSFNNCRPRLHPTSSSWPRICRVSAILIVAGPAASTSPQVAVSFPPFDARSSPEMSPASAARYLHRITAWAPCQPPLNRASPSSTSPLPRHFAGECCRSASRCSSPEYAARQLRPPLHHAHTARGSLPPGLQSAPPEMGSLTPRSMSPTILVVSQRQRAAR